MPTLPGLPGTFSTILIDPPRRFDNRTPKLAPEHVPSAANSASLGLSAGAQPRP